MSNNFAIRLPCDPTVLERLIDVRRDGGSAHGQENPDQLI